MPVKIDFDTFRFERAQYSGPSDAWSKGERSPRRGGASSNTMEFIDMGNALVRELQRVGWEVPFVDVDIDHYGKGKNVIRSCRSVSFKTGAGEDEREVRIRYGLGAGQKGGYNLVGSASSYTISKVGAYDSEKKGDLWDDGSGDWSKGDKWEPVLPELHRMLERLAELPSKPGHDVLHAEGDLNLRRLCESQLKPVHGAIPEKLYVWIKADDLYHAYNDPYRSRDADYAAEKDYVLRGSDYRMVTSMGLNGQKVPYAAWRGGNYATEANEPARRGLEFSAEYEGLPVEITLKDLNDVYVYDLGPYLRAREEASRHAAETGENDWKPGEWDAVRMKAVETFVDASDYKGGYEQPVFMISRQLHKDEARAMKGPIKVAMVEGGAEASMKDEVTGEVVMLHEVHPESSYGPVGHMMEARRTAERAARVTNAGLKIDPRIAEQIETYHTERRAKSALEGEGHGLQSIL